MAPGIYWHGACVATMIIFTTGSTTAISSRSALVVTAMIPAGPTMAGNGSTFAVTTATTKSKRCRARRASGIGAADHGERGISVTVGNWQRVPTLARRVTSNLRLLES